MGSGRGLSGSIIWAVDLGSTGIGESSLAGGEAGAGGAYSGVVDILPSSVGARCNGAGVAGVSRRVDDVGATVGAGRLEELELAPVDPL